MSGKYVWRKTSEFSERAQFALKRFEEETGMMIDDHLISHERDDAIFVRLYGTIGIGTFARLANLLHDGIWVEIDAASVNMLDVRMFFSDWQKVNTIPNSLAFLGGPRAKAQLEKAPESVRVKQEKAFSTEYGEGLK